MNTTILEDYCIAQDSFLNLEKELYKLSLGEIENTIILELIKRAKAYAIAEYDLKLNNITFDTACKYHSRQVKQDKQQDIVIANKALKRDNNLLRYACQLEEDYQTAN